MSDTGSLPQKPQHPLGIDDKRVSTSETARPVPLWHGSARFGVTFISHVFDTLATAVVGSSKSAAPSGYNYYASFAALIGHGVIKRLRSLWFNGEKVWQGPLDITHDYVDLTIPIYGIVRIYAGNETQEPDGYLTASSGVEHPAYRGLAYMVFHRMFLGFNQTNAPNIEVWADRYYLPTWSNHSPVLLDENPIHIFGDWWSNPRAGLGLSDDGLDTAALAAAALLLKTNSIGLSPILNRSQDMRQNVTQLLEYFDGFTKINAAGQLAIDVSQPAVGSVPTVSEAHMTRFPKFTPDAWSDDTLFSETYFRFLNRALDMKEDAVSWRDTGLNAITGEPSSQTLDRQWITNPDLAQAVCNTTGRLAAMPKLTGTLYLRPLDELAAILPGDHFKLSYSPRGLTDLICRCTSRTIEDPANPEIEITFQRDRSYLFTDAASLGGDIPIEIASETPPDPFVLAPIIELPLQLCPEGILSLAVLAVRPNSDTKAFQIHLAKNFTGDWGGESSSDSYFLLAIQNTFAQHGTVLEDYPLTETIDTEIGLALALDAPDLDLPESVPFDALADTLLVFIEGEILSIHRVELVSLGSYRLYCMRSRMATAAAPHVTGTDAYIIPRASLKPLQHPHFQPNNTATIKLAPYSGTATLDLADADPTDHLVTGEIFKSPPPTNLQVNNSQHPSYHTGEDILITWTLTDPGRDFYQQHNLTIETLLEFLDGITLLDTLAIPGGTSTLALSNADLIAILGSEISFTLRAHTRISADWFTNESPTISISVPLVP